MWIIFTWSFIFRKRTNRPFNSVKSVKSRKSRLSDEASSIRNGQIGVWVLIGILHIDCILYFCTWGISTRKRVFSVAFSLHDLNLESKIQMAKGTLPLPVKIRKMYEMAFANLARFKRGILHALIAELSACKMRRLNQLNSIFSN